MMSGGTIHSITDKNGDNRIEEEFNEQVTKNNPVKDEDTIEFPEYGLSFSGKQWKNIEKQFRNTLIARDATNTEYASNVDVVLKQLQSDVADLVSKIKTSEDGLKQLKLAGDPATAKINVETQKLADLKEQLKKQIRTMDQLASSVDKKSAVTNEMRKLAGIEVPGDESRTIGTFEVKSAEGGGGGGGSGGGKMGGAKATTLGGSGGSAGFTPPSTWGADTTSSPPFSTDAYVQSTMMEDNILSSFDGVLKNQNRGKQMMMLFFYFARMAESGDMGAMYQFMKFLTYVISKDKANQVVNMGKKLMELEDQSRQWTDRLMGVDTSKEDSSNDFAKMMTKVKGETDSLAMSQKLLMQGIEESQQVIELLMNATKSILEADGRIKRTISTIR